MTDWLVLGSGSLVETIVESLSTRPGTVRVGTEDDHLASTLRENAIDVAVLDPSDATAIDQFGGVEMAVVLGPDPTRNYEIAQAVSRALPSAYLIADTGTAGHYQRDQLAALADRVIDPGQAVTTFVLDRVGDNGRRLRNLLSVLRDIDKLGVFTHDNPDPDAIASGVALARIATAAGCKSEVCYFGSISHQENRAFVNVLDLELRNLEDDADLSEFDGFALVDHARPGVNDQLPPETEIDIVIDHHPPRAPVDARFVDLRSDVGATSTLLVDYLVQYGIDLDADLATALLFGIYVDTSGFLREVSQVDFEATAVLVESADLGTLERIEEPIIDAGTFDTLASAYRNRRVEGEVVLSYVDRLSNRDALAQAADRIISLDGITTSMVYGVMDGVVYVSARTRSREVDIGETLRDAFDRIGSAGGHVDMAGAQLELGILETVDEQDESLQEIIEEVVADRFLEAIAASSAQQLSDMYASETDLTGEYLGPDDPEDLSE